MDTSTHVSKSFGFEQYDQTAAKIWDDDVCYILLFWRFSKLVMWKILFLIEVNRAIQILEDH